MLMLCLNCGSVVDIRLPLLVGVCDYCQGILQ
jgi:hypothetical protein